MYLKSIEVQGFKSFAHKIVFEFHNGITGIVGPNGSGKSNVSDAVRWVLGEQSAKQLRGAKMEDVIFSGTENRKPMGFAYVALTIDNSDHKLPIEFDAVTVSRRVYRSGESEYLINGTACRLKDIQELFYDTGIGKEGYSIIGQGQIERILSGKPEERRELFDEAAGIVKFKRRKTEAVKKLEGEKQNLIRVEDILSELEKQVEPLEKQAETAKEYLRRKEELKHYDIQMFLLESEKLRVQLKELEEKTSIAKGDLERAKADYEVIKCDHERLEQKIAEKDREAEKVKNEWTEARMAKEKLEGEIALLKEQIRSEKAQIENRRERLSVLESDRIQRWEEEEHLQKEKIQIDLLLKQAKAQQKKEEEQLTQIGKKIREATEQIEILRNRVISVLNEKSNRKEKMQRYDAMLEQIQLRKSELSGKLLQLKSEQELKEELIQTLRKEQQQIAEDMQKEEEQIKELSNRIQKLHQQNKQNEQERNLYQQKYHTKKSQLESLKNLTERYEGYGGSIRRVMDQKEKNSGIIGVVADIIQTEKRYETAIETALGGSIQNIVTDTEQTAKQMIEYLKKNKLGRATFLPLDGITSKSVLKKEELLGEEGVLGIASELIQIDSVYQEIAAFLLGRVVVVDEIDRALKLARKYHYTLRIVTLDGELLNAGGSMTGGAFKNTSNLLGRRREMEELEREVEEMSILSKQAQTRLETGKKENEKNRIAMEQGKEILQKKHLFENTTKMSVEQAEEEKKRLFSEYQCVQQESRELEDQTCEIQKMFAAYQEEITALEEEHKRLEQSIQKISTCSQKEQEEEEEQIKKTQQMQMEYVSLEQKTGFLSENLIRLKNEQERLLKEQQELSDSQKKSEWEITEKEKEIQAQKSAIKIQEETEKEREDRLKEIGLEKAQLVSSQKEGLKKREELSEHITVLDKEKFRLDNLIEKNEESLHQRSEYMWEEYELTYREAQEIRDETLVDLSELKKKVMFLRGAIKELGTVNVNAIEDYKELSERYEFLKTQHDDLIKAEESLKKIIEELDGGMRTQFLEKFEEIRKEFDKVFQELFGGGRGELALVEEEDILEAGIRIISQPPGKKLQNMMQLSGGEKALTAIALLFAIQNLKPSPFCLLDEIEAALDDSNVGRYAKYLHKLTAHTQFIVITHRRGTMTAADRLYGITMQEKGISTLVSVDLIESQLEGAPEERRST